MENLSFNGLSNLLVDIRDMLTFGNEEEQKNVLFINFLDYIAPQCPENKDKILNLKNFKTDTNCPTSEKLTEVYKLFLTFNEIQISNLRIVLHNKPEWNVFSKVIQKINTETSDDQQLLISHLMLQQYDEATSLILKLGSENKIQLKAFSLVLWIKKNHSSFCLLNNPALSKDELDLAIKAVFEKILINFDEATIENAFHNLTLGSEENPSTSDLARAIRAFLWQKSEDCRKNGDLKKTKVLHNILSKPFLKIISTYEACDINYARSQEENSKLITTIKEKLLNNNTEDAITTVSNISGIDMKNLMFIMIAERSMALNQIDSALSSLGSASNLPKVGTNLFFEIVMKANNFDTALKVYNKISKDDLRDQQKRDFCLFLSTLVGKNNTLQLIDLMDLVVLRDTDTAKNCLDLIVFSYQEINALKYFDFALSLSSLERKIYLNNLILNIDSTKILFSNLVYNSVLENFLKNLNVSPNLATSKRKLNNLKDFIFPGRCFDLWFDYALSLNDEARNRFLNKFFLTIDLLDKKKLSEFPLSLLNIFEDDHIQKIVNTALGKNNRAADSKDLFYLANSLYPNTEVDLWIKYAFATDDVFRRDTLINHLFGQFHLKQVLTTPKLFELSQSLDSLKEITALENEFERFLALFLLIDLQFPHNNFVDFIHHVNQIKDPQIRYTFLNNFFLAMKLPLSELVKKNDVYDIVNTIPQEKKRLDLFSNVYLNLNPEKFFHAPLIEIVNSIKDHIERCKSILIVFKLFDEIAKKDLGEISRLLNELPSHMHLLSKEINRIILSVKDKNLDDLINLDAKELKESNDFKYFKESEDFKSFISQVKIHNKSFESLEVDSYSQALDIVNGFEDNESNEARLKFLTIIYDLISQSIDVEKKKDTLEILQAINSIDDSRERRLNIFNLMKV